MRIGMVCYPSYGGSGVIATELGKRLSQRGYIIHFISHAQPVRLTSLSSTLFFHEVISYDYPPFKYSSYDIPLANTLYRLIHHQKIDIIHVHYAIPHAISAYLANQLAMTHGKKVPIITTLHGTDITIIGKDPSYKDVVSFALNVSDGVTAVSKYLKNITEKQFSIAKNIRVIPNFINTEVFKPCCDDKFKRVFSKEKEKIITHISNFRRLKNVDHVVKIFQIILQSGIKAKLIMVGDGPERNTVESLSYDMGIDGYVHYMGKLTDVEEVLSISDLLLMPSSSETFGLAILEALSCGVPIVSSNVGGIPEVNLDGVTGFLSDVGDIDAMAQHAVKILTDGALHKKLSINCRKQAFNFELNRIVTQYETYYDEIIGRKNL